MPKSAPQEFILFKTDDGASSPDIEVAADHVRLAGDVTLLRQNTSALLVLGAVNAVKSLADALPGWESEPNQKVRGGV